ncbi:hypothetical protein Taro_039746 [Colocasia esculenta]|uniref:RING-type E3 ubiquitin transferase n=1 Tax=Colocasia esculenta TaxID=4460 RepID=A0A843WJT4_COLES|nr:hypothetical protein [Colocasia esculenta]
MVGNIDRRFLTLPAVHPAEGVSPAALLQSLVAIARDVQRCYRSGSFPTHRLSVREVVREVGILLQLFEVIQECGGAALLPDSAVLSLCDLHVTFQRIQHLIRDCGHRGARLWLLMRSDRVSCEFRILIRSIATALDVLPLSAIHVPGEVKELVRLVAEQSWKVHIRTDHADALVSREVRLILRQFEKGVSPDPSQLGRVLRHLQIKSWTDCNEEVLFLEEELGAALSSNGGVGEISLLSSLRGFMLYSRTVVFDILDSKRSNGSCDNLQGEVLHHLNLQELRCPISLEFMTDPVTVSTGQTYDRVSITKWLKSGNRTCPITGKTLPNTDLVPNSTLQKLIRQVCLDRNLSTTQACSNSTGGRQHSGKIIIPESSAAVGAVKMLGDFLVSKLSNGSKDERSKTVHEIRLLTKVCALDRGCLVEAGAIPWLLKLLRSSISSLQEDAVTAILNLSKHSEGRKVMFESGGLDSILHVLKKGLKAESRQNAAATIFYLSSVEEYRQEIGETPDAIPALVALLRNGSIRGKKNATVALLGLLLFPGNHQKVLRTGVISDLIKLLSSESEDLVGDCLAVLAAVAERPEGTCAILLSSAVPSLVNLLSSPSSRVGKESCVSILLHLCNNGGTRVVRLLNRVPSLMPTLYQLVLAEGSPRAAKKATSLINILHKDQGTPAITNAQARQEWAVPVQ